MKKEYKMDELSRKFNRMYQQKMKDKGYIQKNEFTDGNFIYMLLGVGDTVLYIGECKDLYRRISCHLNRHSNLSKYKELDMVKKIIYMELDNPEELIKIECCLINYFNPPLNFRNKKKWENRDYLHLLKGSNWKEYPIKRKG